MVALVVVIPLITAAVWAAYAWPVPKPARVPGPTVVSSFGQAPSVDRRIVVARLGNIDLLLPVKLEATTAIAFHPVDNTNAVDFTPVGQRSDASSVSGSLADIFSNGGLRYFMMGGDGSDASSNTGGLDVGAVPGAFVYSPVDGKVVSVRDNYPLLGRYDDTEIQIQLADDPSLLLVITHIVAPQVKIGADVVAGESALGEVRKFPPSFDQQLRQFTTDNGDHVQLVAIRVPTRLSGF